MFFLFIILLIFTDISCAKIIGMFPIPSPSHKVLRTMSVGVAKERHKVIINTTNSQFPYNDPLDIGKIFIYISLMNKYVPPPVCPSNDMNSQAVFCKSVSVNFVILIRTKKVYDAADKHESVDKIFPESPPILILLTYTSTRKFQKPAVFISPLARIFAKLNVTGALRCSYLYRVKRKESTIYKSLNEIDDILISPNKFNKVYMILVNNNLLLSSNSAVLPHGISKTNQKLSECLLQDLDNYLNASKNGVIYFSFGTNTNLSMIPDATIKMFVKVFSELPYDVLWKWDFDELPGRTENIKILKWLPQADLLKHPKVKLFITQGGLQSTDEAIAAGVPLVGIPMLGDQWFNAEKYVELKIGVKLDIGTLNEEKFRTAITSVIEDKKSYRQNMEKLRAIVQDQPQKPLERAVWWIEHILRHGGEHLRSPAANMSVAEYYELDLILIILSILLTIIIVIAIILYKLWKLLTNTTAKSKQM